MQSPFSDHGERANCKHEEEKTHEQRWTTVAFLKLCKKYISMSLEPYVTN